MSRDFHTSAQRSVDRRFGLGGRLGDADGQAARVHAPGVGNRFRLRRGGDGRGIGDLDLRTLADLRADGGLDDRRRLVARANADAGFHGPFVGDRLRLLAGSDRQALHRLARQILPRSDDHALAQPSPRTAVGLGPGYGSPRGDSPDGHVGGLAAERPLGLRLHLHLFGRRNPHAVGQVRRLRAVVGDDRDLGSQRDEPAIAGGGQCIQFIFDQGGSDRDVAPCAQVRPVVRIGRRVAADGQHGHARAQREHPAERVGHDLGDLDALDGQHVEIAAGADRASFPDIRLRRVVAGLGCPQPGRQLVLADLVAQRELSFPGRRLDRRRIAGGLLVARGADLPARMRQLLETVEGIERRLRLDARLDRVGGGRLVLARGGLARLIVRDRAHPIHLHGAGQGHEAAPDAKGEAFQQFIRISRHLDVLPSIDCAPVADPGLRRILHRADIHRAGQAHVTSAHGGGNAVRQLGVVRRGHMHRLVGSRIAPIGVDPGVVVDERPRGRMDNRRHDGAGEPHHASASGKRPGLQHFLRASLDRHAAGLGGGKAGGSVPRQDVQEAGT